VNASESIATSFIGGLGSKERGFATVVELLKDWRWQDGIFVPIYGLSDDNPAVETAEFKKSGSTPGVWRLSTEADKEGFMWTSRGPDIVTANRVQALAHATWDRLADMEAGTLDIKVFSSLPQILILLTHAIDAVHSFNKRL
jgi:U3 small nucleolar RNA-associated protein 22